ncbi:unnamed protein product [Mytilus coruscus]|uniref:Uncharacterized protein n=1 Tax=Mytilus coruscus TaxID=42192 RepID=A0A6J8B9P3_MYTCO|nr:unnamed protein product [Mytilus coruscus]
MLSKEVESNVQLFLGKERVLQRNGVDEATEDLTDIFHNILDRIRSHLNLPKGNRFKSKKRKRKKSSLGFDSECESVYRNLIQSSRSLSKGSVNEEKLKNYYGQKKQFKKLVRKKTRQYKAKLLDSLLELEDKNPKAYWDIINKFKYSDKDISDQSSNIPSDEWYNYFDKLLNVDCSNEQDNFPSRYNVLLDYDINMQEVLKALKSLKNNTSVDNEENENISEEEEIPEEQAIEPQAEPAIEMAAVPPLFNIPFPGKLDLDGNISTNWKKFKRTWDNYEIASGLSTKDAKLRTATLLTCIGPEAMDIFDGLAFENEEDKKDIAKVIEKFETFCIGKTNETFESELSTYVIKAKPKTSTLTSQS